MNQTLTWRTQGHRLYHHNHSWVRASLILVNQSWATIIKCQQLQIFTSRTSPVSQLSNSKMHLMRWDKTLLKTPSLHNSRKKYLKSRLTSFHSKIKKPWGKLNTMKASLIENGSRRKRLRMLDLDPRFSNMYSRLNLGFNLNCLSNRYRWCRILVKESNKIPFWGIIENFYSLNNFTKDHHRCWKADSQLLLLCSSKAQIVWWRHMFSRTYQTTG